MMTSLCPSATIGQIATLFDSLHKTPAYAVTGYPMIRVTDILRGYTTTSGAVRVDEITFEEFSKKHKPTTGDILFSRVGSYGNSSFVKNAEPFCLGQNTVCISSNRSVIEPFYLYSFLNSPAASQQIEAFVGGASQPTISLKSIASIVVPLPPMQTQRRIASILSAYDDLIENNTRRIAVLEEVARRLYEEWFVRFRFPGHEQVRMVESELGLIPEGWEVRGLYDIADLTYGCPLKSGLFNTENRGRGLIRIRDILSDSTNTFTEEGVADRYLVTTGDILIGMDGGFHMGKWAGPECLLNQRVVRLRPKSGLSRYFLYLATFKPIKHLEATIVGTTVAHLSARDLQEMRLLVADNAVMEKVHEILDPMMNLEISLKRKNANLRAQRDLLLPKLISGEIDVSAFPEAEAIAA